MKNDIDFETRVADQMLSVVLSLRMRSSVNACAGSEFGNESGVQWIGKLGMILGSWHLVTKNGSYSGSSRDLRPKLRLGVILSI